MIRKLIKRLIKYPQNNKGGNHEKIDSFNTVSGGSLTPRPDGIIKQTELETTDTIPVSEAHRATNAGPERVSAEAKHDQAATNTQGIEEIAGFRPFKIAHNPLSPLSLYDCMA